MRYEMTNMVPLPGGALLAVIASVDVDQPIEWVRAHADEIGRACLEQDKVAAGMLARNPGLAPVAQWIEVKA